MTARIATVPGTPLLVPEVASGAAAELDEVRSAAVARVAWAAGGTGGVTVLAQDPSATSVRPIMLPPRVNLASLGLAWDVPVDGGAWTDPGPAGNDGRRTPPPVSVLVAAWLAHTAGVRIDAAWSVPVDPERAGSEDVRDRAEAFLLIADGSCTRTPKAPGSFVEGAVEFDDHLVSAIATVDIGFLTDPQRTSDVATFGSQGLGVWALASRIVAASGVPWTGEVDLTADPFGVMYVIGGWQRTS